MISPIIALIASNLNLNNTQVEKTIKLLEGGATIPFLSRYRKEATGNLDEVQIEQIQLQNEQLKELEKRKQSILKTIADQNKLTEDLQKAITNTFESTVLEDLYLPFKQKRKTKADNARNEGLEPLAKIIMAQKESNITSRAKQFTNQNIQTAEEAIEGAQHIIAEWVNENKTAREIVRNQFERYATINATVVKSKIQEEGAEKYKDYFSYEEPLKKSKSHRLLAMRRGEKEGFLKVSIRPDEAQTLERLNKLFIKNDIAGTIATAIKDSYKRLLAPSIETEFANHSKEQADKEAIKVFAENLKQLLLGAPLGEKRILAIDPGFRTGCKLVCLDDHGNLAHNETIYPHKPQEQTKQALHKISTLVEQYKIEAIAIGNGTAGRETEALIRRIRFKTDIQVFVVNEAGASVYSASSIAREEFPNYDVTVRGAVSIGRRLMDPLAELVKIEAKAIGVGQYQHDVNQSTLKAALDQVVVNCVNKVGVDVNTASKHLLTYVSGLGPQLAQNIVDYRKANEGIKTRDELQRVPRMGAKAYEQCAGFLRIKNGTNALDNTAVHPESYGLVAQLAKTVNIETAQLIMNKEAIDSIDFDSFANDTTGLATLADIKQELLKPGLDPRKKAKVFEFAKGITKINDLQIGMELPGIVTNITNFGAFVDVGVKQDGLVHISNLANEYISNPADYVTLHQHVKVKVIEVDAPRKRIGLSMKAIAQ